MSLNSDSSVRTDKHGEWESDWVNTSAITTPPGGVLAATEDNDAEMSVGVPLQQSISDCCGHNEFKFNR